MHWIEGLKNKIRTLAEHHLANILYLLKKWSKIYKNKNFITATYQKKMIKATDKFAITNRRLRDKRKQEE